MQLNQIIQLDITDMTDEGGAIGKIDTLTVFLNKGVIGDKVKAKITKIKKNYITSDVQEIQIYSKLREDKKLCDIQDLCGGCQILDIKYENQLKIKQNSLKQKLERIGGIVNPNINDIISMQNPFRYRNKTQMPLCMKNGQIQIGFYKQKTHEIIPFTDCKIQNEINNKIMEIIKRFIINEKISVYDEHKHTGSLRHIITKISQKKDEIMLILVTKDSKKLNIDFMVTEFEKNKIPVKSIVQNVNTKKTNVILSDKNILLYGKEYIQDMIENLTFNIYPNSFYQVNSIQMEKMYKRALDYANLQGTETVYDLYCGIGTITLLLSQKCKKVYGIEVVPQAIESAKQNAKINNIENAKFICGKVEDEIENLVAKSNIPNVIVLDPARKGCEEKVLDTILNVKPEKIIYISCNPSTLARDLKKLLSTQEYELKEVTPYDLFSHTMHIESVTFLKRVEL
ncbi:MAG: 23S rRNA (uracil(1939)-C(5))-methyltransferase RlmD [Peptoanaerobacter stomatis]|uniref:23S rRNA (uracil(1939)-C(5))-methyltransferase RlmD n=1 Tax=Peptoanaerobacter stomatis TaxID=796937 RepID=UPI003F9EF113